MRFYLKDMEPTEVIDRLHAGQIVYYTDTKGNRFQYQMHRGVLWRYNRDTHEVDGYNRSIYSTGEAYFESDEDYTFDSSEEKFKKYLGIVVKALKELQ